MPNNNKYFLLAKSQRKRKLAPLRLYKHMHVCMCVHMYVCVCVHCWSCLCLFCFVGLSCSLSSILFGSLQFSSVIFFCHFMFFRLPSETHTNRVDSTMTSLNYIYFAFVNRELAIFSRTIHTWLI